MDDEPEVIRQQMEETRSALTDKIEKLEQQVVGTVQNTTQAVSDTVESVKEAVQETVSTVKDTFSGTVDSVKDTVSETVVAVKDALDVRGYVEEYPWASFGAAVATGFVGGLIFESGHGPKARIADLHSQGEASYSHGNGAFDGGQRSWPDTGATRGGSTFAAQPSHAGPSWVHQLTERFSPEIDKLKGVALGALGALVRDLVVQSAAGPLGDRLSNVIDDVTRKLGGEPIRGSLLNTGDTTAAGKSSRERDTATEGRRDRAGSSM